MAYFNIDDVLTIGVNGKQDEAKWEASLSPNFDTILKTVKSTDKYLKSWEVMFVMPNGEPWDGTIPIYVRVSIRYGEIWSKPFIFEPCLPYPEGLPFKWLFRDELK